MPAKDGDKFTLQIHTKPKRRTFQVEAVVSPAALQKGLSGRPKLPSGKGMFFVFPSLDRHSMWMPDMLFALDIVWLDENMMVVHRNLGAAPCASRAKCPNYLSEKMAKYAIEMPAGDAEAYGFAVGTQVSL